MLSDYGLWRGRGCAGDIGGAAPYSLDISFPAGATVSFTLPMDEGEGVPFPWADFTFAYAYGSTRVPDAGVVVDAVNGWLTIAPPLPIPPGEYPHAAWMTHTATGQVAALFDGTLTITRSVRA